MRRLFYTIGVSLVLISCRGSESPQQTTKSYKGTLSNIKKHKTLRVLTTEGRFNYFVYKGKESGYEYDMARSFVKHLNKKLGYESQVEKIKLKMIPVKYDELFYLLNKGYGDIVAAGLTITPERKRLAKFSNSYNKVDELLISGKGVYFSELKDLSGKKVHIRKSSSYLSSLEKLNKELLKEGHKPIKINFVDEALNTETLLEMVSLGKYQITVADSHLAKVAQKVFGDINLNKSVVVAKDRPIAWAFSKGAWSLNRHVNEFIPKYAKGSLYGNMNLRRYYQNVPQIKNRFFSLEKKRISPYDKLFQKYGEKYGWDWRLLAALAYQESRFRQNIKNRWGAIGVMQIKKEVAQEPYVGIEEIEGKGNHEKNIHAGVKYLTWIKKTFFEKENISEKAQIHLSLAAYNAGPGKLGQAQKLAQELGHSPHIWFGELERVMLKMDKLEPVKYVDDIHRRKTAYTLINTDDEEEEDATPETN